MVYNSDAHESPSELAFWNKFTQINCINFLSIISVWFARQFYDLNHQKKSNKVGENLPTREACWPAPGRRSSICPVFKMILTGIFVKMLLLQHKIVQKCGAGQCLARAIQWPNGCWSQTTIINLYFDETYGKDSWIEFFFHKMKLILSCFF